MRVSRRRLLVALEVVHRTLDGVLGVLGDLLDLAFGLLELALGLGLLVASDLARGLLGLAGDPVKGSVVAHESSFPW